MSPPLWALSLPIGSMLILVPRLTSLALQIMSGAPLKNSNPREHAEGKEVAAKDTHGWESMILWSTAVLLAKTTGVNTDKMNTRAGVWLAARVVYIPAYILIKSNSKAFFRTFVFAIGLFSTLSLMWEAALMG